MGCWDALVCPSAEFERTFVPAFEVSADLIRSGYPRNDVLVRWAEPAQQARAAAVREALRIPADKKVLLYAPTFRDAGRRTGQSVRVDLEALAPQLSDEWVVVVRTHPYDRFTIDPELGHFLRDGSAYADINDVMLASDAVLTDYSSLMFDYANTGRPILLYTDDYEAYKGGDRGTYYDLEDIAPGPMLTTTEDLAAAVRDLEGVQERHAQQYARFQEMFCSYETGHASKMVVDAFSKAAPMTEAPCRQERVLRRHRRGLDGRVPAGAAHPRPGHGGARPPRRADRHPAQPRALPVQRHARVPAHDALPGPSAPKPPARTVGDRLSLARRADARRARADRDNARAEMQRKLAAVEDGYIVFGSPWAVDWVMPLEWRHLKGIGQYHESFAQAKRSANLGLIRRHYPALEQTLVLSEATRSSS